MSNGAGTQVPPRGTSGWLTRWKTRRTCNHDWVLITKSDELVDYLGQDTGQYAYTYRCSKCGKRRRELAGN
jgi:hypothetical protein